MSDSSLSATGMNAPMTQTPDPTANPQGSANFADLGSKPPTRHPEPTSQSHGPSPALHGAAHEQALAAQGKLPGLSDRTKEDKAERKAGQEDEAGNKIHHKGVLGHILHWEHPAKNADE
ncbi:hypothetical protein MMC07_008373 [Pseudocyphellaria aurata]|nr:hypothetical protein [Pseudocyphellaria aurata]